MAVNPEHLQRLITRVKKTQAELQQSQDRQKLLTERQRLIDSVPDETITEFYCPCHGDFIAPAGKITFTDQQGEVCAYYVSHGRGYKVEDNPSKTFYVCRRKRYITDKHFDPYFKESKMIQRQRQELEIAMLQPDDPRFKKYYGDPYKKYHAQQEAKAKADWEVARKRTE